MSDTDALTDFTDRARDIARFTFMDVPLVIAFVDGERGVKERPELGVVWVWRNAEERTEFIAPPEQRPFFELMKYDQLRAQMQRR